VKDYLVAVLASPGSKRGFWLYPTSRPAENNVSIGRSGSEADNSTRAHISEVHASKEFVIVSWLLESDRRSISTGLLAATSATRCRFLEDWVKNHIVAVEKRPIFVSF
jgi:hypothetical protein